MTTTRAAVCRAFREPLKIEDVELRGPQAGEVTARVAACAICNSDVVYMSGAWGGDLPAVYGHEAAGVVEEVGEDVVGIAPGDHAVMTLVRFCGRCATCTRGRPALCRRRFDFPIARESPLRARDGSQIVQGLRTAALAERVTLHASQVVRVPDDVPFESAALLACGVLTGVGAVRNTAAVEPGSTVGVIGVGGVGLNVVQGAVLAGARVIVAVDLRSDRLEAARAFGATHGVSADADVRGAVLELTEASGLDFVFVAAGSAAAVEVAVALVADAGAVVIIGMPTRSMVELDPEAIADRSLRILGSKVGDARPDVDIPFLVSLYRDGRLKLDELISRRFGLDEVNDAVASARRADGLRSVVVL